MKAMTPALAAALLLAACGGGDGERSDAAPAAPAAASTPAAPAAPSAPAQPALEGFSHPAGVDLFGYYMPAREVRAGNLQLDHLAILTEDEFSQWEGGRRTDTFAPVMLQFEDTSSPMVTNELGGESRSVTVRVLPEAYAIAPDGQVRFRGRHERLGPVSFEGRLDMEALRRSSSANGSSGDPDLPVLRGTLRLGDQTFDNLAFAWFGGD